jgi:hypothetical protein
MTKNIRITRDSEGNVSITDHEGKTIPYVRRAMITLAPGRTTVDLELDHV